MFELKYIKLNYSNSEIEPTFYNFEPFTYIYGDNNVGKTVMIQAIDFILGSSSFSIENTEGMDGIESIEAKLQNNDRTLYLSRSKNDEFGYKYLEQDNDYLTVDADSFKKEITWFISGNKSKYFEEFKEFIEEDLTFRAFSFFNFMDEKGLGDLTNIFTRIDTVYNHKRARNLMTFIFNYENVSKLIELKRREDILVKELDNLNIQKLKYNYIYSTIVNECNKLQITTKNKNLEDFRIAFDQFHNSFKRNATKERRKSGDLGVLLKISYSLSEELKYQENLALQTQSIMTRNKKAEELLNAFKELIYLDEEYACYVDEIEAITKKQSIANDILSTKDYSSTIEAIKRKKDDIDEQILVCQRGLNKTSYEDTIKSIGKLEQAFIDIDNVQDYQEITEKEEQLKQIRKNIKNVQNNFDEKLKKEFDKKILNLYIKLKDDVESDIDFVNEDFGRRNFKMSFDPLRISISGQRAKSDDDDSEISYNPGSMARETTWQALAYLVMFQILKENFADLPVMPVLFIDGLNQPYDENTTYTEVCKLLRNIASEMGVQLFIVSTRDGIENGIANQIHLTGFNKAHKAH